jgi:hypothetical protein
VRRDRTHDDRHAVGRGLGDDVGADVAACARSVLDDDDAERVPDPLGERSSDDVERAARRVGDDQADRLALGRGEPGSAEQDRADRAEGAAPPRVQNFGSGALSLLLGVQRILRWPIE